MIRRVQLVILDDRLAQVLPDLNQHVCVEVQIGVLAEVWTAETGLDCERVCNRELFPADDATGAFLGPLHREGTVHVAEDLGLFLKHIREDALAVSCIAFL